MMTCANSLDSDQAPHFVGLDLNPDCLHPKFCRYQIQENVTLMFIFYSIIAGKELGRRETVSMPTANGITWEDDLNANVTVPLINDTSSYTTLIWFM